MTCVNVGISTRVCVFRRLMSNSSSTFSNVLHFKRVHLVKPMNDVQQLYLYCKPNSICYRLVLLLLLFPSLSNLRWSYARNVNRRRSQIEKQSLFRAYTSYTQLLTFLPKKRSKTPSVKFRVTQYPELL